VVQAPLRLSIITADVPSGGRLDSVATNRDVADPAIDLNTIGVEVARLCRVRDCQCNFPVMVAFDPSEGDAILTLDDLASAAPASASP
jgi:hypothetical protein